MQAPQRTLRFTFAVFFSTPAHFKELLAKPLAKQTLCQHTTGTPTYFSETSCVASWLLRNLVLTFTGTSRHGIAQPAQLHSITTALKEKIVALAFVSILEILGMTVLFPTLAALGCAATQRRGSCVAAPTDFAILIPAHNEERLLPGTLTSIKSSIKRLQEHAPCNVRIMVGVDGCTDTTEAVAARMNTEILKMPTKTGKWGTISALVKACSDAQWVILADCGVEWPDDFLLRLLPVLQNEDTIGVAPTYRNDKSGIIEKIIWGTESAIKRIESKSGGPVSVHGATVCYRTKELCAALDFLSHHRWLNDDVVIPLCLRALYPSKRIQYRRSLAVKESVKPTKEGGSEFRRRRRLVHGNIQWIKLLWGSVWERNYVAALLACRRVFRLLWAYWVTFSALAVGYYCRTFEYPSSHLIATVLVCSAGIPCIPQLRNLFQSGLASVLAPYYFTVATVRSPATYEETQWN